MKTAIPEGHKKSKPFSEGNKIVFIEHAILQNRNFIF
jgi:hypothetical protein